MKASASYVKLFLLAVFALSCLLGTTVSADENAQKSTEKKTSSKKGDFELYNAIYHSALIQQNQSSKFLEKKLFLLNTRTGETWMLIDVMKGDQDVQYWKKITASRP